MMTARMILVLLALSAIVAGCGGDPSSAQKSTQTIKPRNADDSRRASASAWDDCAGHLQELCGQLFAYYAKNRKLPRTLEELAAFPGPHPNVPLTCPESKKPYVYEPDTIRSAGSFGRIVIHDPEPAHAGHRWAVAVREVPGPQLIAEVVRVPESVFALPPQPGRE
jgi:hypothetical protein